jgi:hypothetical protein
MFNPRGTSAMPYWLTFPATDTCTGFIDPYTGVSTSTNNATSISFQVAISVLTGTATLWNAEISASEPTTYHAEQSSNDLIMIATDYDGDHIKDGTVQGTVDEVTELFTADPAGNVYGVFLTGSPREDGQPNFTRIMDVQANTTAQGLVSTIHKDDLRNTDIYAFRESTGELITERIGMPEQKVFAIGAGAEGLTDTNQFTYSFAIRSPEDMLSKHSKRHSGWEDWQADNKINPKLHSRQSDFIRTGEQIRIVAINRATGYIGTALTTLNETKDGGDLTVFVPPITLKAPNLKVWATRRYQPQGLLQNADTVRNTISNEGAATSDDYLIEIHTQWTDENGLPLPDHLKDRGYTGRLVKVASNAANPYQTRVQEFAINPGRHLQVIKFKEGEAGKYHYYLQVNGKSGADENDFSTGAHTGVLRHRPSLYVTIKVQLYNEQETKDNTLAQKKSEAANSHPDGVDFTEQALFDWVYRPELSFSVVDLEVQKVLLESEETGEINIISNTSPVISSEDDIVRILFELSQSEFDRITPLDGEQEFILAIGEQEYSVTIDKGKAVGQQIQFTNLEHLAEIDPEDYLSIRFYLNQDSQNVLWDWAFTTLDVDVDSDNNNGFDEPDRSLVEEESEAQANHPGKMIRVNNGDINQNDIPDFAEFDYIDSEAQRVSKKFVPFVIEIPAHVDILTATIKFEYAGSDPEAIQISNIGTVEYPEYTYIAASGNQRLWIKNADTNRTGTKLRTGGDYIKPDEEYGLLELGFNSSIRIKTFYIEGIRRTETSAASIRVYLDYPS